MIEFQKCQNVAFVLLAAQYDYETLSLYHPIAVDAEWQMKLQDFSKEHPVHMSIMREDGDFLVMISDKLADFIEGVARFCENEKRMDEPWRELGIDIETFSSVDITECGLYKYAESPDFEILLFAWSKNGGASQIVDLAKGEKIPEDVWAALNDPNVLKTAYNAPFERVCINRHFGLNLEPEVWDCTMVAGARMGFPMGLDACGAALGIEKKKMREGKALIKYFCVPCKPSKANGGRTRNMPEDAPDKWRTFKKYCLRDVDAEQEIRRRVTRPVPAWERSLWVIDQRINDRGVMIDEVLAGAASRMDEEYRQGLKEEAIQLTGLENPNSLTQLKTWIEKETGMRVDSLNKDTLPEVLKNTRSEKVRRMLQIRAELGKTSTTKYTTMLDCMCQDGRIRGLLQFYGAVRTGRWAGRLVQLQNLPQNHIADIEVARAIARQGDMEELELSYGNVPGTLSELVRTALVARPGHVFHVCDFSAIEARVIAWLAGEEWVLEVFRTTGKIYEAAAARMYHVPAEDITKTDPRRQKGKIATLALGYEGGVGAFKKMGGDRMGLTDTEIMTIIQDWRQANPYIVRLWRHVEAAAMCVARAHETAYIEKNIAFEYKWGGMRVTLPSGRCLFYPRISLTKDGRVCYEGVVQDTHKWGVIETYGGKLTENIVQAIARDCLGITLTRLDNAGFPVVFHIHDEAIAECWIDDEEHSLEMMESVFQLPITWARGLPLKGAGYSTPFYMKD